MTRLRIHIGTVVELLASSVRRGRFFLVPLLVVLLLASALLVLTELFPAFAPFVYAIV